MTQASRRLPWGVCGRGRCRVGVVGRVVGVWSVGVDVQRVGVKLSQRAVRTMPAACGGGGNAVFVLTGAEHQVVGVDRGVRVR